ncbi:uncharacterized protein SCHCODRAFT_02625264 [Schizophyllum commune H4-8]|nr:uncharacterized protein SCHCODRAFT_02625264 [Schizophyllum commune H4-8]KAI5892086.1 hypothetical protein SCHCODRAFT_02625264 [Schizophyllum commune H4-8]
MSLKLAKIALFVLLVSFLSWRTSAELDPSGAANSASELKTTQSQHQDEPLLAWFSEHDGWRSRATLLGPSALPANLTSSNLLFAVTESGMIGDIVLLTIFTSPDFDAPSTLLHTTASDLLAGAVEQVPIAPPIIQRGVGGHEVDSHIAIDAAGHMWRLYPDDYAAFLGLLHAAEVETKEISNFYIAHTATCQSMFYLVHPDAGAERSSSGASTVPIRKVGVDAYSKYRRKLSSAPSWDEEDDTKAPVDEADEQRASTRRELPQALYELLGLAQEGAKGFWDEQPDAEVLRAIRDVLPRSLLSRLYLRSDYASA